MARWEPDPVGRLAKAALELFAEQGYERTTVAEIAQRAGLTKRTFFRYFTDKREVLFVGSGELTALFASAVADAPASAAPLDAIAVGLDAVGASFEPRRPLSRIRAQVIAANPELQERELIKLAGLAEALADALRGRGVGDPAASLAAQAGVTVFQLAFARWVDPASERTLRELVRESLGALRALAAK